MFISNWLLILLALAVVAVALLAVRQLGGWMSGNRSCARCGAAARHGYSQKAESAQKDIEPLCVSCLPAQLEQDYSAYQGRVLVVQPVSDLPCYVFRDREHLKWVSPEAQDLDHEIQNLLGRVGQCKDCGHPGHCLWIESRGLDSKTLEVVLKRGLAKTILAWDNPPPISLCGECSAKRISQSLRGEGFSYLEVCSPHGVEEGIVLPMGY
ncbi:MAG: hypothetical protein LAO24_25105 [Acidobacteriia bacterium]|nr:hypothetical protein [Terriglobia bacterium]